MNGDFAQPRGSNIALLIDADNASPNALDPVLTVLAELGTVNVRRVYGNWVKTSLKTWATLTLRHGLEPYQQFDITKGKNATDMRMTIDAMDLMYSGRVTGFGIMSSDSDFMPLALRLKQEGLPVYGFGRSTTPEGFREACTRFIDVDAIAPLAPEPAAGSPPPSPASIGDALPPAIGPRPKAKPDAELIKLLIDAYDSIKRDERGYVSLSAMGQLAGNRSSFDVRNYGYKRLSDLIEAIDIFQIDKREGGRAFVKRVR